MSKPLVVESPSIDANGFAIGTNDYYYNFVKTGTELSAWEPITQIRYKVRVQTANKGADFVVLTSETGFSLGLGVKVQLILDEELLEE